MTLRAVRGMAAVTLAVPFSVLVDVEGERASDPFYLDDWRDLYNSGIETDVLGRRMTDQPTFEGREFVGRDPDLRRGRISHVRTLSAVAL